MVFILGDCILKTHTYGLKYTYVYAKHQTYYCQGRQLLLTCLCTEASSFYVYLKMIFIPTKWA